MSQRSPRYPLDRRRCPDSQICCTHSAKMATSIAETPISLCGKTHTVNGHYLVSDVGGRCAACLRGLQGTHSTGEDVQTLKYAAHTQPRWPQASRRRPSHSVVRHTW